MSEFYPTITKPLRGARAFKEVSETASQPQAAILLMLARQLRGDDESLVARAKATRSARRVSAASPGSENFPVPKLMNLNPEAKKCTVERRRRQWPQRLSTHRRLAFDPTHSPVQQRTQLRRRVLLHVGEDVGVPS